MMRACVVGITISILCTTAAAQTLNGFGLPVTPTNKQGPEAQVNPGANARNTTKPGSKSFASKVNWWEMNTLWWNLAKLGYGDILPAKIDVQHPDSNTRSELVPLQAALDSYSKDFNRPSLSINNPEGLTDVAQTLRHVMNAEVKRIENASTTFRNFVGAYAHGCDVEGPQLMARIDPNGVRAATFIVYFEATKFHFSSSSMVGRGPTFRYNTMSITSNSQETMSWQDGTTTLGETLTLRDTAGAESKIFFDGRHMVPYKGDGTLGFDLEKCVDF